MVWHSHTHTRGPHIPTTDRYRCVPASTWISHAKRAQVKFRLNFNFSNSSQFKRNKLMFFFSLFSLIWLFAFTFCEIYVYSRKGTSVSTLSASAWRTDVDVDDNDEMQIGWQLRTFFGYLFRFFFSSLFSSLSFFFLISSETKLREFYMFYLCVHVAFSKLLSVANSRGYLCIARIAQLLPIDFIILCFSSWRARVCVFWIRGKGALNRENGTNVRRNRWEKCNQIFDTRTRAIMSRTSSVGRNKYIYVLFGDLNSSPTYLFMH